MCVCVLGNHNIYYSRQIVSKNKKKHFMHLSTTVQCSHVIFNLDFSTFSNEYSLHKNFSTISRLCLILLLGDKRDINVA